MKTWYESKREMDMALGGTVYSPTPRMYVGLSSTPVQKDGSGITEPQSTMNYSRVEVPNTTSVWSTTVNGEKYNLIDLSFTEATGEWGTMSYVFVSDAQTGGNILFYEALPKPRKIQENSTVMFKQQTLKFKDE